VSVAASIANCCWTAAEDPAEEVALYQKPHDMLSPVEEGLLHAQKPVHHATYIRRYLSGFDNRLTRTVGANPAELLECRKQ